MSAPSSLTMTTRDQLSSLSSVKSPFGSSSSGKISLKESDLIDSKFNELAQKIMEELKQAQYSQDFFVALDGIIKEPKMILFKSSAAGKRKYSKFRPSPEQQLLREEYPSIEQYQQPKSLEMAHSSVQQYKQQSQQQPLQRQKSLNMSSGSNNGRQRNYSSISTRAQSINKSVDDYEDDDEEDEDEEINKYIPNDKHSFLRQQKFNPILKSKTISDTSNISEINESTKKISNSQKQQQPQLPFRGKQGQHFNQIVRSSTISHADFRSNRDHRLEPDMRTCLTKKDMGSLYKPNMNYSTSVLGNHRLSDDDEIIIIPTQSPSLVSTSPDADSNLDELTERFSISRTKSFWEKLSKGNPNKRKTDDASDSGFATKAAANPHYGNKVIGVRMNGHSHTLDRMDSTGGSNSNYSCSSSGDENCGSNIHPNPTISQLQEMSRQNRFRQTR